MVTGKETNKYSVKGAYSNDCLIVNENDVCDTLVLILKIIFNKMDLLKSLGNFLIIIVKLQIKFFLGQ